MIAMISPVYQSGMTEIDGSLGQDSPAFAMPSTFAMIGFGLASLGR